MRYIPEFLILTVIFLLMDIVVQRLNIIGKLFNHELENGKNYNYNDSYFIYANNGIYYKFVKSNI